jgi:hypothetical protein
MKARVGFSLAFHLAFAEMDDDVALLQLSQRASLTARNETVSASAKLQEIAQTKNPEQASVLVEELAISAVEGNVFIDDGAKAALSAMKTTLENSQELIKSAHTIDQNLRNTHADRAAQCLTTFDNAKAEDAELATQVSGKHSGHVGCRERLSADDADMLTKCNDLEVFISQINPPCTAAGRSGMTGFWSGYKTYYDGNFPAWQEKEAACATAEQKRAATDAECDGLQRAFETSFCSLRLEMLTTCSEYNQCHSLAEVEFDDVMVASTRAEASRKIEWTAIEKIKCYIDVLVSDDENDAKQAALTACKDLDPGTSHLTLTAPSLPVPPPCDLAAVSIYPCTDGFVNSRYDGLMDVEICEACPALPSHLGNLPGSLCTTIEDDGEGWSPSSPRYTVGEILYHSYDKTMPTLEKTISLLPGVNYKWTAVIDTWASVDNEPMRFCAVSAEFGEDCEDFSSRVHNQCDNGWTQYSVNFGRQVGSPKSSSNWVDCFEEFEKIITGPASGSVTLRMHMALNQDRDDEAWGWHDMKMVPTSCPLVMTPFAMDAARQVCSKNDMLAAGWSWTGCTLDHHGGSSLCSGIWCHSQAEMHLKVPPLAGTGTCTATWRNDYTNTADNGFVRLMKNGVQLGEARATQTKTVTFSYTAGDELELWEGFAIAKADENWLQCDTGAAATAVVTAPVAVDKALVCGSKAEMLAAGWTWTGCSYDHHGGDSLCGGGGIWCHSQEEMHLRVPLTGGPSTCTATWQNAHGYTSSTNFVRLMKNGQQLGEAMALEEKTVTFTFAEGDEIEFWEGFAIVKVSANWLHCS